MKIAIIGASGFLGKKSYDILSKDHDVIGTYSSKNFEGLIYLDASIKEEAQAFLNKYRPEIVIDTTALTSSTKCEQDPELAEKLNYLTAKNISEASQEIDAKMFFISSSYVFDGEKGNYTEEDETNPLNVYGKTKLMAENEVLKNPKATILRVEIMYGYNGKDYGNGVFDMILNGNPIKLREIHQIRQPLFVDDVPRIILELARRNETGIFHLGGSETMTILDFLKKLEKLVRTESIISGGGVAQGFEIKIPNDASLNTNKIQNLGIKFTPFGEGLKKQKKLFR